MLEVERIQVSYGAAPAISEVSLRIGPGELACVVGPNGAGKTTLINAIAGLHRIEAGALRLDGRDLSRLPRHAFCGEGIAIVPEGRRLFVGMSVRENLELGSYRRAAVRRNAGTGLWDISHSARAARAAGGHALGRPAADARDRARADGPAAAAASG